MQPGGVRRVETMLGSIGGGLKRNGTIKRKKSEPDMGVGLLSHKCKNLWLYCGILSIFFFFLFKKL